MYYYISHLIYVLPNWHNAVYTFSTLNETFISSLQFNWVFFQGLNIWLPLAKLSGLQPCSAWWVSAQQITESWCGRVVGFMPKAAFWDSPELPKIWGYPKAGNLQGHSLVVGAPRWWGNVQLSETENCRAGKQSRHCWTLSKISKQA